MNSGIYMLTSPSGKIYIGQTHNYKRRMHAYDVAAKSGSLAAQPRLWRSVSKHGWNNFQKELLHPLDNPNQDLMNLLECFWIWDYDATGINGLNCMSGGSRGKHSEESKAKMSVSRMGNRNCVGRVLSQETRSKVGLPGRVMSGETRSRMSRSHTGKSLSPDTIDKIKEKSKNRVRGERGRFSRWPAMPTVEKPIEDLISDLF